MNKGFVIRRLLVSLIIFTLIIVAGKFFFIDDEYKSPAVLSSYSKRGYYEFNPETLLGTLDRGKKDAFTPFFGDPDREEPYYRSIAWSQADILEIISALGEEIWNEPLDLETWKVSYFTLQQRCEDVPDGFYTATIVYYKYTGTTNLERIYIARRVDIISWQGLASWGEEKFSVPLLSRWHGTDLTKFNITADDALKVAEANGGLTVRQDVSNACNIILSVNMLHKNKDDWIIDYDRAYFYMRIDPYSGKYKILE